MNESTALRARAFGLDVVFFDPLVKHGVDKALGVRRAHTLDELLSQSHFVSLHCYLDETTHHLIDAASLAKIYTCGHLKGEHQPECASKIITDLARRAFRKPVTPAEVEKIVDLVKLAEKEEGSFAEGLAVGIQAILISPEFLFRIEHDEPKAASHQISQHELATRLSYFLWTSMPDDELRRAADAGKLRDPKVLAAQLRRMRRAPKAAALAENFGGQWLQFRALESTTRDRERHPDFEPYSRCRWTESPSCSSST